MSGVDDRGKAAGRGSLSFAEQQRKDAAWSKGRPIPNFDPAVWRYDDFGRPIRFDDFCNRTCEFGWEIGHIRALAQGGSDTLANLRPLRCQNSADS